MIVDGQISAAPRRASAPRSTRRCASTHRASRSPRRSPTTCCPAHRGARHPHRAHGDALALHPLRPEGLGEGGAIAPPPPSPTPSTTPRGLGAELLVSPITPRRIVEAIAGRSPGRCGVRTRKACGLLCAADDRFRSAHRPVEPTSGVEKSDGATYLTRNGMRNKASKDKLWPRTRFAYGTTRTPRLLPAFYAETFPDSAVGAVHRAPSDYPPARRATC
jgi:hypothetical protein